MDTLNTNINSLHRFTNRVLHYVASRPSYPVELIDLIVNTAKLSNGNSIADIGAGTGISSKCFLERKINVFGVEPNEAMLNAAKKELENYSGFIPINGTAEATELHPSSLDAIVCAQAFHWLNCEQTRNEFLRILKPDKYVFIFWNDRSVNQSQFLNVYEDFISMFASDYKEVNHRNHQSLDVMSGFFNSTPLVANFPNKQLLNFNGLLSRVLSSSYMPDETHPEFDYMKYVLRKIYNRFQEDDCVCIEYNTQLYYGKLKA